MQRTPLSAHRKQQQLVTEFVYWLVQRFVIPLLRTTFYVTEAAAFRQRVLYFRQDAWARLSVPLVSQLRDALFEPLPKHTSDAIKRNAVKPFSNIRLLPKDTTVRPIVNLRRRTRVGNNVSSVNTMLQSTFDVLTYERKQQPIRWGAAITGPNVIHERLADLKTRLLTRSATPAATLPHLYFVKGDIRAAFDSLDQQQLLRVVRDLLDSSVGAYYVQRYTQVRASIGAPSQRLVRRAMDDATYARFTDGTWEGSDGVLVDHVTYALEDRRRVWDAIYEHVTNNLVMIDTRLYRQRVGIAQGSILSTMLCNLLLGDLERSHLQDVLAEGCLLRYTDDFLFITPSRPAAETFCHRLHRGFPEYGCQMASDKCLVNFDVLIEGHSLMPRISADKPFPWCGYVIDPRNLSVQADPARRPFHLGDALTVRLKQPGAALAHKIVHLARARAHELYTDASLNAPAIVCANLLEGFVLAAARLHAHCRALRPNHVFHASFLYRTISVAVYAAYPTLQSRSRIAKSQLNVRRRDVEWLGFFAFNAYLSSKHGYDDLCSALYKVLLKSRYDCARAKIGTTALRTWRAMPALSL